MNGGTAGRAGAAGVAVLVLGVAFVLFVAAFRGTYGPVGHAVVTPAPQQVKGQ